VNRVRTLHPRRSEKDGRGGRSFGKESRSSDGEKTVSRSTRRSSRCVFR